MIIESAQLFWMKVVSYAVLFGCSLVALYPVLDLLPRRTKRWRSLRMKRPGVKRSWPSALMFLLMLRKPSSLKEREQLLRSAGVPVDIIRYEIARRLAGLLLGTVGLLGFLGFRHPALILHVQPVYLLLCSVIGLLVVLFDRILLEAAQKQRAHKIVKEIYTLSNQLLYYSGSKMNLHTKLSRCVPYTRAIRRDLQLMINEWYQDPDQAIRRFKLRLGTDEAYSFAETLRSLRLNESGTYYELLRERIRDYKEKIDLARESRKETVSYVLFVIAGLPILNTFRVFMYPWVMEGQKLFQSLN